MKRYLDDLVLNDLSTKAVVLLVRAKLEKLSKPEQRFVLEMLETVLAQASR